MSWRPGRGPGLCSARSLPFLPAQLNPSWSRRSLPETTEPSSSDARFGLSVKTSAGALVPSRIQRPPPGPGPAPRRCPALFGRVREQGAARGGGGRRDEGAETRRQGADLLPGARPLLHSGSGSLSARLETGPSEQSLGGLCPRARVIQKGALYRKPGSARRWMRSRDTGAPSTCRLQRMTRSHRNYTEDSDRGICPSKDAQTDRRAEADCTAQSGQAEADAG